MWIEETKSGKYKFVEQYRDFYTGKKKRVYVTLDKNTAATRRKALEMLTDMIDKRISQSNSKKMTLQGLIEKYRIYQEQTVKPSTYKRNYFACETIMKLLGADTLVERLNANYIKECFLASGKEPGTLNEHRARLKALLNWGYENEYIADVSYMKKFKPFKDKPHREKIEDKFLEHDEVKTLINSMDDTRWSLLTEFLILSGLRFGEAAALTLGDIDLKNNIIHVKNNYDSVNKLVTTPKTDSSVREVYIQPELVSLCKRIKDFRLVDQRFREYISPLFFPYKNGSYISFYSYNKYLKENSLKALGRSITPHTLRHTHASLLLAQGIDIDTISRRLGHENSKITKEIYLHITEKLKERDQKKLSETKII